MAGQVKMSELRAKYPMYQDVSDEQFLGGLHKKLYSDLPVEQFRAAIDFDTGPKATDGMSGGQLFMAGAGKAFKDIGQGAGQLVGVTNREDVAATRKQDADLMGTGWGFAGNVTGNVAALLPSVLIPGAATIPGAALIGAATGFLAPSVSDKETLTNTAAGGALGPAGILAGRALGATYQGGKALLAPFFESGRKSIAANTIKRFAGPNVAGAANALDAPEIFVQGSKPTVGELTQNAGLAQLQRSLKNADPSLAESFTQRELSQSAARTDALRQLMGEPGKREFYDASRKAAADQLYGKAFADGIDPAAITPKLQKQMESLLSRPSIKDAMAQAKLLAQEEGITLQADGSVQGLHYAKKALDDMIATAGTSGLGPSRKAALVKTQGDLLSLLDEVSPTYKEARTTFAEMSKPINQMDVVQALYDKVKPALSDFGAMTRESSNNYANALRNGDALAAKATGLKGAKLESVMAPEQMDILTGIAKDLARKANASELGKATGSNTAQNLIADNLISQLGGPLGLRGGTGSMIIETILGRPAQWIAKASQPKLQAELAEAMLDPAKAAALLRLVEMPTPSQRLGLASQRYLAPGTLGLTQGSE